MKKTHKIQGSIPAIITPMFENGDLDLSVFKKLIDWHIKEGSNALVVVGTSGESPTLSNEEHIKMIKTAVKHSNKRIPIIAGIGANSTKEAIELTKYAKINGAQATLQVVPYYNKPTQNGIYKHFTKIAESVNLPLIIYNVPARTMVDISNKTILKLSNIINIIGIKESSGNMSKIINLLQLAPKHFNIYSGDDATAISVLILGGHGNISVTANIAPKQMSKLCKYARNLNIKKAKIINTKLFPLHINLFIESNPIPVKWALKKLGLIKNGIRLPLTKLSKKNKNIVYSSLLKSNIIKKIKL